MIKNVANTVNRNDGILEEIRLSDEDAINGEVSRGIVRDQEGIIGEKSREAVPSRKATEFRVRIASGNNVVRKKKRVSEVYGGGGRWRIRRRIFGDESGIVGDEKSGG